jgi:hypothetical protein
MTGKKSLLIGAALAGIIASGCANQSSTSSSSAKGECHKVNSCKGTGACGGKGHGCAGQNSCKGKGWVKLSKSACNAKGGAFVKRS